MEKPKKDHFIQVIKVTHDGKNSKCHMIECSEKGIVSILSYLKPESNKRKHQTMPGLTKQ